MKTSWSIELYFLLNLIHFLKKLFILFKYFYSLGITYSIYQTCSFSFLGSSQILSHPSYSPNFLFFLSLKAETKKKHMESNLFWTTTTIPGNGACVVGIASDTPLEKTDFLSQQVSITSWLGVRLCLQLPPCVLGFLSGLNLYKCYVYLPCPF